MTWILMVLGINGVGGGFTATYPLNKKLTDCDSERSEETQRRQPPHVLILRKTDCHSERREETQT